MSTLGTDSRTNLGQCGANILLRRRLGRWRLLARSLTPRRLGSDQVGGGFLRADGAKKAYSSWNRGVTWTPAVSCDHLRLAGPGCGAATWDRVEKLRLHFLCVVWQTQIVWAHRAAIHSQRGGEAHSYAFD